MTFTSRNELRLRGGTVDDRRAACAVLAAADWGGEPFGPEDAVDGGEELVLRFESVDALPDEAARELRIQFPELELLLCYVSFDGEFCGFLRGSGPEEAEGSEDFPDGQREALERAFAEDPAAYVRGRFEAARLDRGGGNR